MSFGTIGINQGTQTAVPVDTITGTNYPVMKLDIGAAGATNPFTGTFLGGTINTGTTVVTTGTITGTITQGTLGNLVSGTVDTVGLTHANWWGTTVFTGTNVMGTIKPSLGAGTRIYVTDLIISVGSASNVVIGDGTSTTSLAGTFFFAANGGLTSNFRTPLKTSQGGTLVFAQSAAIGSCTITAFGYYAP